MDWRLTDRTLDLAQPLGAAIVNVTVDSMFEGARSGTPEQAVADGEHVAAGRGQRQPVGGARGRGGGPGAGGRGAG